jgi:hypothetical protein
MDTDHDWLVDQTLTMSPPIAPFEPAGWRSPSGHASTAGLAPHGAAALMPLAAGENITSVKALAQVLTEDVLV